MFKSDLIASYLSLVSFWHRLGKSLRWRLCLANESLSNSWILTGVSLSLFYYRLTGFGHWTVIILGYHFEALGSKRSIPPTTTTINTCFFNGSGVYFVDMLRGRKTNKHVGTNTVCWRVNPISSFFFFCCLFFRYAEETLGIFFLTRTTQNEYNTLPDLEIESPIYTPGMPSTPVLNTCISE